MRELERRLSEYPSRIVEHATISSILLDLGYKSINDKVAQLKQKGVLTSLRSGLYVYNPPSANKALLSYEIVANILLGPSYVSLDYALWYYGLIPESVYEITSVSTKRSAFFETVFGVFSYKQIKKKLFAIGLEIQSSSSGNFLIASKEKALCDKVYFTRGIDLRSKKAMLEFLEDDLRIDLDELVGFNVAVLESYAEVSRSKKIDTLAKVIGELQR